MNKGVQTNPPTDPPGQPARSDPRIVRPDAGDGSALQEPETGGSVDESDHEKLNKTDSTVLSPKKVVVFRRWERFAGGFSPISLEMA